MKPIRLDDDAADELAAACAWYEERMTGLGESLAVAVDTRLVRIEQPPGRSPPAPGIPARLGVRRALLLGFPFAVFFIELETEIRVVAIAHLRRRPGYWRKRLRKPTAH